MPIFSEATDDVAVLFAYRGQIPCQSFFLPEIAYLGKATGGGVRSVDACIKRGLVYMRAASRVHAYQKCEGIDRKRGSVDSPNWHYPCHCGTKGMSKWLLG